MSKAGCDAFAMAQLFCPNCCGVQGSESTVCNNAPTPVSYAALSNVEDYLIHDVCFLTFHGSKLIVCFFFIQIL